MQHKERQIEKMANRLIYITTGLLLAANHAFATPIQSESSIRQAAKSFIATRHPWMNSDHTIDVGQLDTRTRLPRCQGKLEAFMPPGTPIKHRNTVGIRCAAAGGWTIYLPVTINAFAHALVATQPIPAGTQLTPQHVTREKRNISSMGYGYVPTLNTDGGYRTTRSISQGALITPNMLESAVMIKRGQAVKILAHSGPIDVSMAGIAMSEASLGKRISVKNPRSGRVIEGIVRSAELVEVVL